MTCWVILTGEYPPKIGGVGAHTQQLAQALTREGDEVHVWAPNPCRDELDFNVHALPDCFGPTSLAMLDVALNKLPPGFKLLVQYVPHAFGWAAMYLPFCLWLQTRRKRDTIWVYFHEVAVPRLDEETFKYKVLRNCQQLMAGRIVRAA